MHINTNINHNIQLASVRDRGTGKKTEWAIFLAHVILGLLHILGSCIRILYFLY